MTVEEWLGKNNKIGIDIWHKKYQHNNETIDEFFDRVSGGNYELRNEIVNKRFLPGGRILAGRGVSENGRRLTMSNCYVIPAPEDNLESIFDCAKNMARTYSYGGGCGTDLSNLSPRGAIVRNAAKTTSGAVSFMNLYSATTESICQEGRRGALMLTLSCYHPDIEEFIDIKRDLEKVTKANISVKFTDAFMKAAENNETVTLSYKRESTGEIIEKTVIARDILRRVAENNWMMGEPGALFWDLIINYNLQSENAEYKIRSTNPCGEQPLPDGGSCLLGSINLAEFVTNDGDFDWKQFEVTVKVAISALNEILDEGIELHPLKVQRDIARDWRNCGLGIMGLADCLIKMRIEYGSNECINFCDRLGRALLYHAMNKSCDLAQVYGAFPKCNSNAIVNSAFFKANIESEELKNRVSLYGLRNCSLLTIAPTGTLSTMLGVSGGAEPIFSNSYTRKTESLNGDSDPVYYKIYTPIVDEYMKNHGLTDESELPFWFVTSSDLGWRNRVEVQATLQRYIDSSISSTVNLPETATVDDIYNIYMDAWKFGCKGITVYRNNCARTGILATEEQKSGNIVIKELKRGEVAPVRDDLIGMKRKLMTGCGSLHCMAFFDPDTKDLREVYLSKGSTGGCNQYMVGSSRLISLCARAGVSIEDIVDQLNSCGVCPSYAVRHATKGDTSPGSCCLMAVGRALLDMKAEVDKETVVVERNEKVEIKNNYRESDCCPQCGTKLVHTIGCISCPNCDWSKCG